MKNSSNINKLILSNIVLNGPIIALFLTKRGGPPGFFVTLGIILSIFIIPGLSWAGLVKNISKKEFAHIFFSVFLISSAIMLLGNILSVLFNSKNPYTFYYIYTLVTVNIGILVTNQRFNIFTLAKQRIAKRHLPFACAFILLFVLIFYQAGYGIPPLQDNNVTVQGTAYGLINSAKPHMLTDDGMKRYYFAHPLLLHFYGAHSILLSGHIEDVRYYYDYAKIAEKVQKEGPSINEIFQIYISPKEIINVKIIAYDSERITLDREVPIIYLTQDRIYPNYKALLHKEPSLNISEASWRFIKIENKSKYTNSIPKVLYEQIVLRPLMSKEYKEFFKNPHVLCTRISNIFFVFTTLLMLFFIMIRLKLVSPPTALLLCFLYISLPEISIRSIGGSYTAISNFFLVFMIYFYLINHDSKLSFLCGVLSGLSNHKLLLLPIAIVINKFISRRKNPVDKNIIIGFGVGILLFWVYGLSIDHKIFFADHFRHHLINRIFHVSQLGYTEYHSLAEYWKKFISNLSWYFFIPGFASLLLLLKEKKLNILPLWFLSGGIIFSLVDWKETKHLMLIAVPLLLGIAYSISLASAKKGKLSSLYKKGIIFLLSILLAFNCYSFTTNNGFKMLNKIGIYCAPVLNN